MKMATRTLTGSMCMICSLGRHRSSRRLRLSLMSRNDAFFQSLNIESVKPRRSVKQRRKKAKAPVDVATSRTLRSATAEVPVQTQTQIQHVKPRRSELHAALDAMPKVRTQELGPVDAATQSARRLKRATNKPWQEGEKCAFRSSGAGP